MLQEREDTNPSTVTTGKEVTLVRRESYGGNVLVVTSEYSERLVRIVLVQVVDIPTQGD